MDDAPDAPEVTDLQLDGLKPITPRPAEPGIERLSKMEWRACNNCAHSAKEQGDQVCRIKPPKVFMFMMPGPPMRAPNGQMVQSLRPQSFTQFPVVQPDQWCGKFEKRGG